MRDLCKGNTAMKRAAKSLLLLTFYLLFSLPHTLGETATQKISDSIYVLTDKDMYMNSTLIMGDDTCILVDTRQNVPTAKELQATIKSITDRPIKYVINTHYHGDHVFGNQIFTTEAADIVGHKNARSTLLKIGEQHKAFFRDYFKVPGMEDVVVTPPTLTFEKELSLQFNGKTINIFHPDRAHTNTDSFVYIPELKMLITGDLFFNHALGFTGDPSCSLKGWIETLEEMERLDIETIIPGHGPLGNKDNLAEFRQYLEKLLAAVKQEIDKGKTVAEMKQSIKLPEYKDWGHYDDWLGVNVDTAYTELSQPQH